MKSHEIIRETFDKTSPKQIAAELGISLSLVYKWGEPAQGTGSGAANPLDRICKLMKLTRNVRIIQWLSHQMGGFFLKNPKHPGGEEYEFMPAANEIVQQFADLLSEITQSAVDNSITAEEATRIREVWDELKSYVEGFVKCCEDGDFAEIRRETKG